MPASVWELHTHEPPTHRVCFRGEETKAQKLGATQVGLKSGPLTPGQPLLHDQCLQSQASQRSFMSTSARCCARHPTAVIPHLDQGSEVASLGLGLDLCMFAGASGSFQCRRPQGCFTTLDGPGSRGSSFGGDHKIKQKWMAGTSSVRAGYAWSEKQPKSMIHTRVCAQRRTVWGRRSGRRNFTNRASQGRI